jgi:TPR repeat protein
MGIGVPRDFQQAYHYYHKASKKGNHKEAKGRVELLENLVKYQKTQKNEKRRTMIQDKKLSSTNNNGTTSKSGNNTNSRDSQCNIM